MALVRAFDLFDYILLAATLLVSLLIGLYYAFKKGGQTSTKEFLLGGRKMPVIPTALSLLVSFQSGILILGFSSEMYLKGTNYFWYIIGVTIGLPMAMYIYLPVFYNLKLVSSYEYLELRFKSKSVRIIGSTLFLMSTIMYMAVVLYAPSVALSTVTGINLELLIVVSGLLCTVYTALGGLKAVVWTDAFQALVMYVGFFAIIIQGFMDIGGPMRMWEIGRENGRITTDFSASPFTYMNFWSVVIGTAFGWMSVYGTNQTSVQRYTSLDTLKKARLSLFLVMPGLLSMFPLVVLAGLVMYAYYSRCDPLMLGAIKDRDQLLPYFTMDVLGHAKGLPGLFVSCLVSSTLSTISSGLNSMAAVVWEDFLKPKYGKRLSEGAATRLNKILACLFGVICVGLACVTQFLGGVFQASMTVLSAIGGPLSGLFLFGILFPWGNKYGALSGVIVSAVVSVWICFGAQLLRPYRAYLPRSIAGCGLDTLLAAGIFDFNSANNLTSSTFNNVTAISGGFNNATSEDQIVHQLASAANISLNSEIVHDLELTGFNYLYKISYVTYGLMAILLVFVVGIPVSLFTGMTKTEDVDPMLVWPFYSRFLRMKNTAGRYSGNKSSAIGKTSRDVSYILLYISAHPARFAAATNMENAYILSRVLDHLPLRERLLMETVCSAWYITMRSLWRHVTTLYVANDLFAGGGSSSSEENYCYPTKLSEKEENEIIAILQRCGSYLRRLHLAPVNVRKPFFRNVRRFTARHELSEQVLSAVCRYCVRLQVLDLSYHIFPAWSTFRLLLANAPVALEVLLLEICRLDDSPDLEHGMGELMSMCFDRLVNLRVFSLWGTCYGYWTVTDRDFQNVPVALTHLDLSQGFTAKIGQLRSWIPRLTRLRQLHLERTSINDSDLKTLVDTCRRTMRGLTLAYAKSIVDFSLIAEFDRLRYLRLDGNRDLLNDHALRKICEACTDMRLLSLENCSSLTSSGLRMISKLNSLRHLSLCSILALDDASLATICANCVDIRSLQLKYCRKLTRFGLVGLTDLRKLSHLGVSGLAAFDQSIAERLRIRCPKLSAIEAFNCDNYR